jgi:integrase
MPRGETLPWPGIRGGFIRRGVYGLRRTLRGRRYEVSLRVTTATAALEQLARFERDPERWHPAPADLPPVLIDEDLVRAFLASSKEKGNSDPWRLEQKRVLGWWADELAGVDLRRRDGYDPLLLSIKPALAKAKSKALYIRVLKTFCAWVRFEKHLLDLGSDPVAGRLRAPIARPAQWDESRVIPLDDVGAALKHLAPAYRDALDVLLGTGWHVREVVRFAGAGLVEPVPAGRELEGAAVITTPRTKRGNPLRSIVSAEVEAAARRVRDRGALSEQYLRRAIGKACAAAKVEPFGPGSFRHTVATFAVNAGVDLKTCADFLNHLSEATTKRFYATHAIPRKVPTPR